MNKKYLYALSIITIFVICNAISGQAAASPYKVGDSFTFTVSQFSGSEKVNGTTYSSPITGNFTKTNTYTVTAVNKTTVNMSYPSNGVNKTTYADIDGFMYLFLITGFGMLGFQYTDANNTDFSAPDNSSSSTLDLSEGFFPMFASGNVTAYKESFNTSEISDTSSTTTDPYYTYKTNTLTAINNQNANTYTISLDLSFTKSNATQKFSLTFASSINIVIDLTRNIVTTLGYTFNWDETLGTATNSENIAINVVEGTGSSGLFGLSGVPGFEFLPVLAFMSIIGALVLIQKRRKQL